MQSVQESKQELEAAIRYAENAISSAKATIESMEFRQEMAKKQHSEQTGREQTLQTQVTLLEERIADMQSDMMADANTIKLLNEENDRLKAKVKVKTSDAERWKQVSELQVTEQNQKLKQLARQKADLEAQVNALEQPEQPTMPVIPKAVAIAIFREGVAHGVSNACDELDNASDICIEENEYCGDFEVSFSKYIDLSDHLDLDWIRDKVGNYEELNVINALMGLCADKEFECRIHGVDDQEEKKND